MNTITSKYRYLFANSKNTTVVRFPFLLEYITRYFSQRHLHSFVDIFAYLEYLQDTYEDLAEVITIGKSAEGRELKVVRISAGKSSDGSVKPAIWIDGGKQTKIVNPN